MIFFIEPYTDIFAIVAVLLMVALCALCLTSRKIAINDVAHPRDLILAVRAGRMTDPRGYFYVQVPLVRNSSASRRQHHPRPFLPDPNPSSESLTGPLPAEMERGLTHKKCRSNLTSWDASQLTMLPFVSEGSYYDAHVHYEYPYTAFLTACWKCDYSSMKAMLHSGADPSQKTDEGSSGLVLCTYRMAKGKVPWKPKCLKLLLTAGCSVDEATNEGNTALHFAVKAGSFNVVQWLLEHGANKHKKNQAGWSPVEIAVVKGDETIINMVTSNNRHLLNEGSKTLPTDD